MKRLRAFKGLLFVLPSLIGVMIFYLIPFLSSMRYCFWSGVADKKFVGLMHFKELLHNGAYMLALRNTGIIIGSSLPIVCIGSIIAALLIEKNVKGYKWVQGMLLIPIALPAASLMLMWQDLFMQNGVIDGIFGIEVDWLNSEFAPFIIIFMIVWKNIGYSILLIIGSLLSMSTEYEEAASLEGAGFFYIAVKIKIPYIMPMIVFSIVMTLRNCFSIFREVYLLQGDYPSESLYLLQHFMNNNFAKLNYDVLTTAAFMLYAIIFMVIYIMIYWQQKCS